MSATEARTAASNAVRSGTGSPALAQKISRPVAKAVHHAVHVYGAPPDLALEAAARGLDKAVKDREADPIAEFAERPGSKDKPAADPTTASAPSQSSPLVQIPAFPWPYPRPSARAEIDRTLLTGGGKAKLADVDRRLSAAFQDAGYGDKSYYSIPQGFVMVSRMEQIDDHGVPTPGTRWSLTYDPLAKFTMAAISAGSLHGASRPLPGDLLRLLPSGTRVHGSDCDQCAGLRVGHQRRYLPAVLDRPDGIYQRLPLHRLDLRIRSAISVG